jgi:hypothetical protein
VRSGQQVDIIHSGFGKWMNTIIIVPENWFIFLNKWWNFRRGRFAQAIRGYPACFLQPATTPLTKPGLVLRSRFEDGDTVLISAVLGDIARAKGMTQIAEKTGLDAPAFIKHYPPKDLQIVR